MRVRIMVAILMFFGCFISTMLRVNYTVLLSNISLDMNAASKECGSMVQIVKSKLSKLLTPFEIAGVFAAYELGFAITLFNADSLEDHFGATVCIGVGLLLAAVVTMFSTFGIMYDNLYVLLGTRFFIGLFSGHVLPQMSVLMMYWSPVYERHIFGALLFGSSIGVVVTFWACSWITRTWGADLVIYSTGGIALIWSPIWLWYVCDCPIRHSRVTQEELNEITWQRMSIDIFRDRRRKTPWSKILRCPKIRALFVLLCCNSWNLNYFTYYGPLYFKHITSSTDTEAFWLTSAAFLFRMVFGILSLPLLRWIIIQNRMSVTVLRKTIAVIAQVIPGTIALATISIYCQEPLNIAIGMLILGFNGAFIGGGFINALDLTPHFAQAIFAPMRALICVITATMPFVVAYISELVKEKMYVNVSMIGLVYLVGGFVFITFGSATVQPWDIAEARRILLSSMSLTHLGSEVFDTGASDQDRW